MRPCHRAIANTPHKVVRRFSQFSAHHAAFTQLRGTFGLWGDYLSRLLRVYCSLRPDDLLTILKMALSIDERFGFPLPLYPSYEVSDFYLGGFAPTEHISLLSFPGCTGAEYPPAYTSVYASLGPSR
jgi:hypothetical protein